MADSNYEKLQKVLEELFMFDQADLDFGIYRIINVRRAEIRKFLDNDLLPQVKAALGELAAGDREAVQKELQELVAQLKAADVDPESSGKYRDLRAKLAEMPDGPAAEDEVYSHLAGFFRRYYSEGDFISQRRYKEGVYAIPYEGEEVKLHWANADQYYIKSSEQFRDYTFLLGDGRRVHFKLIDADTERNNNRAAAGKDRRFLLTGTDPVAEQDGELLIRFEYRPDTDGRKREVIDRATVATVLSDPAAAAWHTALSAAAPTNADPGRTLLAKHVNAYTGKNTFDYFIHKDLGTFLRRELDFYLKNEVMHLDDIDTDDAHALKVENYLAKLKAIRRIAHKIIDFVAQLEDFQKRLWLKKKFVVKTSWCVTLDRIDPNLYPEIAANEAQREEWVRIFAIDDLGGSLPPYTEPLTVPFLEANPHLPVDTALFSPEFTQRVLSGLDDLEDETTGLLIQGDNFQALGLIQERYSHAIRCVYVDPPYNTDASAIAYKNDYKSSSWITLVSNRLSLAIDLIAADGVVCCAVDDEQEKELRYLSELAFPRYLGTAVVRSNPQSRKKKGALSPSHEYAMFFGNGDESRIRPLVASDVRLGRYPLEDDRGRYAWLNLIRTGSGDRREDRPKLFFPIYVRPDNSIYVPRITWSESTRSYIIHDEPAEGEAVVYPIVESEAGIIEKRWHRGSDRISAEPGDYRVRRAQDGKVSIDFKTRMDDEAPPSTWWDKKEYASANYGAVELKELFGEKPFDFPKAVALVEDCLLAANGTAGATVLDYFAGSGTTAHAAINLNREDGGNRKYVLVEMGEYFDTVMKPRVLKAAYSRDWKDGKPVSRDGMSQLIKVIRIESYEDTLNNLRVPERREPVQQRLLDENDAVREEYMLRYWVDLETRGSPSLLTVEQFDDPWAYEMEIARGSAAETRPVKVDLVETFNYLLGLRVRHIDVVRGVTMLQGTLPSGEKVLVIWRKTAEMDSEALDKFLFSQSINPRDMEFAVIYVNGDNHLENSRRPDETWKVRLIEDEFRRLMFEEADR